jgi:hypothetical protein
MVCLVCWLQTALVLAYGLDWLWVVSKFDPCWSKFQNDPQNKGCFNREFKIILNYSEKQTGSVLRKERLEAVNSIPY